MQDRGHFCGRQEDHPVREPQPGPATCESQLRNWTAPSIRCCSQVPGPTRPREGIERLIFESKTTQQVAGTAYGLVQAAGEYLDHVRTARSWETRLNRTLIRPEPLKHRALSLVREITAA